MKPPKSRDIVIVGAGIVGMAVAVLATSMEYNVVVFRLGNDGIPRCDTLRNQGWLQSGVMYPHRRFKTIEEYETFANKTYMIGRDMLRQCGLPLNSEGGIIGASDLERVSDLKEKAKMLNLNQDEFRQLETDEVDDILGDLAVPEAIYHRIPDVPFDEAGVLEYLRSKAVAAGVEFVEVQEPVSLKRKGSVVEIHFGDDVCESQLTLIAAGSGSFSLVEDLGHKLSGTLQRTPLMVSHQPSHLPSPVYVDLDAGFSAVCHDCQKTPYHAVVVGTKARNSNAARVDYDLRNIPTAERKYFESCLPPILADRLYGSHRFTAGYEVIPSPKIGITPYQPWIEDFGNVVFASPGRATVAFDTARLVMVKLIEKISLKPGKTVFSTNAKITDWDDPIMMHFNTFYGYNDAE